MVQRRSLLRRGLLRLDFTLGKKTRGGWVGEKVKCAGEAGFSTFPFSFKLCTVLFTNWSLSGEATEDNVATFKSLRFKRVFTTDLGG